MNQQHIERIQKRILKLLPEEKREKKALLLGDCCSELSRLVAVWIREDDKSSCQTILKGDNVCNTSKSHDILANIKNGKVYVIDPTIWQFFPNEDSILIGEYPSIGEAIAAAVKKYGGQWQKSEDLQEIAARENDEWLRIVKENIQESSEGGLW